MKHFLCIHDCTRGELEELLTLSAELKRLDKTRQLERTHEGKVLAMVFEKASLRTRMSFEIAMSDLGGSAIYLKPEDIGILGEREPIKDVARVLGRYVHAIMCRTYSHQTLCELAEHAGVPVINALSDWTHPCQAMADALTIREHLGSLEAKKIAFIGDGNNVARSLAHVCAKFDMTMSIASPAAYALDDKTVQRVNRERPCLTLHANPVEAVTGAHVIYTDTWVSMGQEEETERRLQDFSGFQVNAELLAHAPRAKIMHCLPAHRGHEITDEIAESANAIIFDQAENRLHFQRALLAKLLG